MLKVRVLFHASTLLVAIGLSACSPSSQETYKYVFDENTKKVEVALPAGEYWIWKFWHWKGVVWENPTLKASFRVITKPNQSRLATVPTDERFVYSSETRDGELFSKLTLFTSQRVSIEADGSCRSVIAIVPKESHVFDTGSSVSFQGLLDDSFQH